MKNTTSPCSDDQLRVLLHGEEHEDSFRCAAEHLEACTTCQSRLAELAESESEWAQIKQWLVMDQNERLIEHEQAERSWSASGNRRPPKTWTDAMTRQLLSPPSHPEMLGRLGRYEVERLIGVGGMGVVFKAFDSELNRPVAIKVLAPYLAGSGAARQRFAREACAAAAIVHEHVVAIHNVESDSEPPFLVMQYVSGQSLQCRLDREGPLSVCEVLRIARQTAAALAAAHEQGLVHRDVKPSNILLEEGVERALLSDFGLARASDDASLTQSGHAPGTPNYMSPEQARGEGVDHRSDLFSLGSVMYAMCTGRPSFRAQTSYGVLRRITDEPHRPVRQVNPDVPVWLAEIVDRLLAKDPDRRFQSAAEVVDVLGAWLAHVQQPEVVPPPHRKWNSATRTSGSRGRSRFFKLLVGAAFAAALFFAGILIVLEWNKGTLTIECSKDGVPVKIMKGENVYDRMTVTPRGNSVRIAAGQYVVEIEGDNDGLTVENNVVTITRGDTQVVRIVESPPVAVSDASEIQGRWRRDGSDRADYDDVIVRLRCTDGRVSWRVGDEEFNDLTGVETKLARLFQVNAEASVIIVADNATPLRHVIDVCDLSRQVGFDDVQFAAAKISGILEFDERFIVNVHTRVPSRIEQVHVDYKGVEVNQGDPLVTLFSSELYSAEQEFLLAHKTNDSHSSPQHARILESTREKLGLMGLSDEQIDQVAKRNKASGRLTLSAPRDGVVTAMDAHKGKSVTRDARLFTIADPTRLWATLYVNETQLELFRFNQPVTLTTHAYPGRTFPGNVLFIEPTVNPETRSIVIRVEVSNPQSKLKPGMSVTVRIRRPASAGLDTDLGYPFNNIESDAASIGQHASDGVLEFSRRSASEFQSKLSEARSDLEWARRLQKKGFQTALYVKGKEERLSILRAELAAQIRLLELKLKDAHREVAAAKKHLEVIKQALDVLPRTTLIAAQEAVDAASSRLQRAQTLLDLYGKIDETDAAGRESDSGTARSDALVVPGARVPTLPNEVGVTVRDILAFQPEVSGIDYDQPTGGEIGACRVVLESGEAWTLFDRNLVLLRRFVDTNHDGVVDLWAYYKSGKEVYREADTDYDGKIDHRGRAGYGPLPMPTKAHPTEVPGVRNRSAANQNTDPGSPLVQLGRIGRAMQEYHQRNGRFPPAAVIGPDAETLHSWRVELLPLLGHQELYDEYHLNEPWDSAHNKSLIRKMPSVYRNDGQQQRPTYTRWLAVTGPETVFPDRTGTAAATIIDGTSNTAMLVEATNSIPWTKPEDLTISFDGASSNFKPTHRNGFSMLLCDGSPCFVAKSTPRRILDAFLTRSGGEVLPLDEVQPHITFYWATPGSGREFADEKWRNGPDRADSGAVRLEAHVVPGTRVPTLPNAVGVTVRDILAFQPEVSGIEYDQPTGGEIDACRVVLESGEAWTLFDRNLVLLRRFVDANHDGVVDLWAYYKSGKEVYREADTDYDGKIDHRESVDDDGADARDRKEGPGVNQSANPRDLQDTFDETRTTKQRSDSAPTTPTLDPGDSP